MEDNKDFNTAIEILEELRETYKVVGDSIVVGWSGCQTIITFQPEPGFINRVSPYVDGVLMYSAEDAVDKAIGY